MMNNTVVAYGPQGSGKTSQAGAIAALYGCTSIVEEWDTRALLVPGALHLTNVPPTGLPKDVILVNVDQSAQ